MHEIMASLEKEGLVLRRLTKEECSFQVGRSHFPIVIQTALPLDAAAQLRLLHQNKENLKTLLTHSGALLFRGFLVNDALDFQRFIESLDPKKILNDYFMREAGRDLLPGTSFIFDTDSRNKGVQPYGLGGFHSENYFSTDVPRFQSFWCKVAADHGGESAIVDSAAVYDELPERVKKVLAETPLLTKAFSLQSIAAHYRIKEEVIAKTFADLELPCQGGPSGTAFVLRKPNLWRHPVTRRLSLQTNVTAQIPYFDVYLARKIRPHYPLSQWPAHRIVWGTMHLAPGMSKKKNRPEDDSKNNGPTVKSLADLLNRNQIEAFADSVWRNTTLIKWQRSDVLVFDNSQTMHAGMPWRGQRELGVVIADPVAWNPSQQSGILDPLKDSEGVNLHEILSSLRLAL